MHHPGAARSSATTQEIKIHIIYLSCCRKCEQDTILRKAIILSTRIFHILSIRVAWFSTVAIHPSRSLLLLDARQSRATSTSPSCCGVNQTGASLAIVPVKHQYIHRCKHTPQSLSALHNITKLLSVLIHTVLSSKEQ